MITASELRRQLHYNPETGIFTWSVRKPKVVKGAVAGKTHPDGYIVIGVNLRQYLAQRLAWLYMTGSWPTHQIDHINGIKNDNRWVNLRDVPKTIDCRNKPMQSNNTSGFTGVNYVSHAKAYRATAKVNGKFLHLGYYPTAELAAENRKILLDAIGFTPRHGE